MKGCFINKFSTPEDSFSWQEINLKKPNENEVLIEVEAFGVNYADVMARQGLYGEAPTLPFVPGYEVVGRVIEVGENAALWLGKRVLAFTRFGGYASHAITSVNALALWQEDLKPEDGLALATQYVTAYYATQYVQQVRAGEVVLIQAAAGGVGIALNQICKQLGATTIGLCSSQSKIDFCKAQGFDYVFNYNTDEYLDEIKSLFPSGIDVCFNSLAGKSFKNDKKLLNHTGRMVLFGGASRSGMKGGTLASLKMVWQMGLIIPIGLMMGSKSIIGINMLKVADFKPLVLNFCLEQVVKMYHEGLVKPVVKSVFEAKDIEKAHLLVEQRASIGKVVCRF